MVKLIITDRIHKKVLVGEAQPYFISTRDLTRKEVSLAREMGLKRYYLPTLSELEGTEFLNEFDKFWDQMIKLFGPEHKFWRNIVSSKIQEWERSATYLAIVLFTIVQISKLGKSCLIIVCSSIEEESVCEEWGKSHGWKVEKRPFLRLPLWTRRFFQETKNMLIFFYMFGICLYKKLCVIACKPKMHFGKNQILIASLHYLSSFRNGTYLDPFFGNLHNSLEQHGYSVTYLSGSLEKTRKAAQKLRKCKEVAINSPYALISWGSLILLALKVFIRRIRVRQTTFMNCDFSRLINWNARRSEFFWFHFTTEIYYAAIRRLCKLAYFGRLILVYEGNVLERGCIQAFRKYGSGTIIGYSQATIFPFNLKIRLTANEILVKPEPDIFVCTGTESERLLKEIGNRESSLMYSGCSLRYIPVLKETKVEQTVQSNILFALDGDWGCFTILDWLIEHAVVFKDYRVKIRAHPNMPLDEILNQCLYILGDNFQLSNGDIKTDIKNSLCVIYRSTSVGMQAIMNGVPAIHLNINAPLSYDPIMALNSFKWAVQSPEELSNALNEIRSLSPEQKKKDIGIAGNYLKDYFTSPDDKNIKGFMATYKTIER